ncbi:type IV secretory system conjugative DNA transfer family protein [Xylella fastidiosa subsp. multiplex]|uniref:Type IV secretory system conjugative DNA transfer family protein n=1 Tax=Xylella fastidiosa subsp. multiplex TaxID=644357 RepID=A0AAW6HYP6_XYLFS|nr:type IV secretory system conjugative DNA transfer family protein [Xylella fastidiosa]MDC6409512.1 type IV secretory system conjugative DNA transfer family protein [Xylella fastidiosa subsp. multiplex]MDC6409572.1 type IV secretory system conjugative DNA transfer family protein [Xylella fastidiosa subsp. multiplex]MDD0936712.1 type IV secretory system conjugative DNA transfer family protein [Xylella fastidiosa subsp. multiplex]
MTLNLSENNWVKAVVIIALVAVVTGVWAYLAGGIFLMAFGHKFEESTPLTLYQYWFYYGAEKQAKKWLYISSGVSLAVLLAPLLFFFSHAERSLFGDARFAKLREIKDAGLMGKRGIILGLYMNTYLLFGGSQHVSISAPTRSGKGVGIVIPNLLSWPDSVVCSDIKIENFAITSAYRQKHGQECYLFNPVSTEYKTHRYNPLSYISEDPHFRIDDIQKIGNMLFPDVPGTDVIWTATPRSLFLGIVLMLLETQGKLVTLGQVLRETLQDGDGSAYFGKIINERAKAGNPYSGPCIRALNSYISIASENTRSGVMTSFRSKLELWMNPIIDAATSGNDFDLRDLRKKRMSVFVGVTPDNLKRLAPLLNLFYQQLIDLNTRELPEHNPALKYQCLLMMDEFTALGKLDCLADGISFIAGYGLRLLPIFQSPAQIVSKYGEAAAETFSTNHAAQIIYPPKVTEIKIAREISEWLGFQTVKGVSESKGKGIFTKKSESQSISDQRRALLLPQEITSLGSKRALVVVEDCPPILAKRIRYFSEHVFMDRLKSVSPSLAKFGSKLPNEKQLKAIIESGELAVKVPVIDIDGHICMVSGSTVAQTTVVLQSNGKTEVHVFERLVTPADMPNLAKIALANLSVDFSAVEKQKNGQLDEAALRSYAENFCKQAGINM